MSIKSQVEILYYKTLTMDGEQFKTNCTYMCFEPLYIANKTVSVKLINNPLQYLMEDKIEANSFGG